MNSEGRRGVSHAEGSSPIKSSGNVGFQVAAATGSWREGVIVLVMVLAPIGLAAILMAIGLSVIAIWQICARDSRQPTNADKHSALWVLVVRCRQLDRRGGRVALVVTPRAQRQCVSVSETDVASADSRLRGLRDRNVRRAYPDTL